MPVVTRSHTFLPFQFFSPDGWPGETTWAVKDVCDGNRVVESGGPYSAQSTTYTETADLGDSMYALYIYDSYGDGLDGSYTARMNGVTVASKTNSFTDWDFNTFGTPCPSSNLSLDYQGDNLGSGSPLTECGGDCDNDGECQVSQTFRILPTAIDDIKQLTLIDCLYSSLLPLQQGDLVCFQRDGSETVPGCAANGASGNDYCYRHFATYGPLKLLTNGLTGLQACEGDCDQDSDCVGNLLCMQRETEGGWVPGCEQDAIDSYPTEDFCYDPTQGVPGPVIDPTPSPTPSPVAPTPATWSQIFYEDFSDDNLFIEPAGGKESKIQGKVGNDANGSLELSKNKAGSIGTSDNFDVSSYQEVKIDFWYYFKDTASPDNFVLKWSSNGGSSWTNVETVDYVDEKWHESVITWNIGNADNLMLRFEAEIAEKKVYIDDVDLFGR
jgi:hypothetical protein